MAEKLIEGVNLNNDSKINLQENKDRLIEYSTSFVTDNAKFFVSRYENIVKKAMKRYYNNLLMRFNEDNSSFKEKKLEDNEKLSAYADLVNKNIKNRIEKNFDKDVRLIKDGINEILNFNKLDEHSQLVINNIKNGNYSIENIKKEAESFQEKFEKKQEEYLLKKMKYKELLEINKLREKRMKEGKFVKKEFDELNNYLDNFSVEENYNGNYQKLKNFLEKEE